MTTMELTTDQHERLEALRAQLARNEEEMSRRAERIANYEVEATDCALSMWAADSVNAELRMKIKLLEDGEVSTFPQIFDLDGNPCDAKLVQTKFGRRWAVKDEDGQTDWLPDYHPDDMTKRKETNLRKRGYTIGWIEAPAVVKMSYGNYIGAPSHPYIARKQ